MPNDTPALYSLMNYADMKLGTWYPMGGMHKIIEAFEKIAIENGVKETLSSVYPIERVVEKVVEVGVLETKSMDEWVNTDNIVNKVMNNGIKEVQPLPAQDGNRDWGNYYYRKGEPTKPHTKYVDDVLEKGEKI